jgi:uncharacterized protein (UPF0332 family)/predicted nucleotidyltransferase
MVTPRIEDRESAQRAGRRAPSPKVVAILRDVKAYLKDRFGEGVRSVILYGSQARGEAHEGSDVDVALIVEDRLDPRAVERSLDDLLLETLLERGELVTVMAFRESDFEGSTSPLIMNIKEEGWAPGEVMARGPRGSAHCGDGPPYFEHRGEVLDHLGHCTALLEKSGGSMRSAEKVLEDGDFGSVASMAYHAMYHAVEALLLLTGVRPQSHARTLALVDLHLERTGELSAVHGEALRRAHRLRIMGDYSIRERVTRDEAESVLRDARELISPVKSRMSRVQESGD